MNNSLVYTSNISPSISCSGAYSISSVFLTLETNEFLSTTWEGFSKGNIFGLLSDWKINTQKFKDELREAYD